MSRNRRAVSRVLLLLVAACALGAAASAGSAAERQATAGAGGGFVHFNGGFTPAVLSKNKPTPVAFNLSGNFQTIDGTHPPALTELLVEADKNLGIHVEGYPKCFLGIEIRASYCKPAVVGRGTMNIEIAFPEEAPILLKSKALVFNGGEVNGVTTLFLRTYITVPTPAVVTSTVKIRKVHNGRFATEAVATIPKIAGGSGSVTAFDLTIDKKYAYKGKKVSVLTLKCPDGKILTRARAIFADGSSIQEDLIRTCKPSP
jgi:hypothetical protein